MVAFGGIESGGTKTVVAVGDAEGVHAEERFPTGPDPEAAMQRAADFLTQHGPVDAVGFGSFGPCDPDPKSPTYGHLGNTPKPGWGGADVLGMLAEAGVEAPIRFDTDVNAAALGEWSYGAGMGRRCLLYVTVGTGIGGGVVVDGRIHHGAAHPEMGHQRIAGAPDDGVCDYHGNCWEGVASGPAIAARLGVPAEDLPADHPAWQDESELLAMGLTNLALTLSPDVIVLGGGVGARPDVQTHVRAGLADLIADYVAVPELVPPALGDQAGIRGAFALAALAHREEEG